MKLLFLFLTFTITLVFISCNDGLNISPDYGTENSENEAVVSAINDNTINYGTKPRVIVSGKNFKGIYKFSWNQIKFNKKFSNHATYIGMGKYYWRYAYKSRNTLLFKNNKWKKKIGYEHDLIDLCAIRIPNGLSYKEACFAISGFTKDLYFSDGNNNFKLVTNLGNKKFLRVDGGKTISNKVKLALIGVDGSMYFGEFLPDNYTYKCISLKGTNSKHQFLDIASGVIGNKTVVYALSSGGVVYRFLNVYQNINDYVYRYEGIDLKYIDIDRDMNVWIVDKSGNVYFTASNQTSVFTKLASNLANDIAVR